MSRYDGLIIPRSYSEYINKTDAATLQQALQLADVLSKLVAAGDNKAVTSSAVNTALSEYINKTDAETLQQALQLSGVLSDTVTAGDNRAVKSDAVNTALSGYINKTDAETLQQASQLSGVLSDTVTAGDNRAVKSDAVNNALIDRVRRPLTGTFGLLGGAQQALSSTVNDLLNEISQYGGICGGSAALTDISNSEKWYLFLYIPHRDGKTVEDASLYGVCLLFEMTGITSGTTGQIYIVHRVNGVNYSPVLLF